MKRLSLMSGLLAAGMLCGISSIASAAPLHDPMPGAPGYGARDQKISGFDSGTVLHKPILPLGPIDRLVGVGLPENGKGMTSGFGDTIAHGLNFDEPTINTGSTGGGKMAMTDMVWTAIDDNDGLGASGIPARVKTSGG